MAQTPIINTIEKESILQKTLTVRSCMAKTLLGISLIFIALGNAFDRQLHAAPQSAFSLSVDNQQFSAHIIRTSLKHVLETLATHEPFRLILNGNAKNDVISSSFSHLSFKESLETLLLGYDYAIIQHQLDPIIQTHEMRSLMEVLVLTRNPSEPYSDEVRPSYTSLQKISNQLPLLQASKSLKKSDQSTTLGLETDNNESDFQATVEEALQDTDPESLALLKELLEE